MSDIASRTPTESVVASLCRARQIHARAITWICDHVGADGTPAGSEQVNGYYRVPWTLAVAGRPDRAAACLEWIRQHALTEDGDLREGVPTGGFVHALASYPLTQIAIGAHLLERYEIASTVWDVVRSRLINAETGGAYAARPAAEHAGREDLINTCQMGIAALTLGRPSEADGAFRWLRSLWDAQPALPDRLYTSTQFGRLLLEVKAGTSTWNLFTDFTVPKQQYYNPGIAAAFLGRYSASMGDATALDRAWEFLDLNVSGIPSQFDPRDNMQICKFAWGAGVLLDVSGTPQALEHVLRMVDWFEQSQLPAGSWHPSAFLKADPGVGDDLGKTAEHALHLSTMIRALGRALTSLEA
jgi:hypothetical protein